MPYHSNYKLGFIFFILGKNHFIFHLLLKLNLRTKRLIYYYYWIIIVNE